MWGGSESAFKNTRKDRVIMGAGFLKLKLCPVQPNKVRGIELTVSHAVQNFARSFKEACEQRQYIISVQGIEEVVGAKLTVTATQPDPIRSIICLNSRSIIRLTGPPAFG